MEFCTGKVFIMDTIKPMLAKPGKLPINSKLYGYEVKWDGIRALLAFHKNHVQITSRNLHDITGQYPELQTLQTFFNKQGINEILLDGEIVAFDKGGRPSFSCLQKRMGLLDPQVISKEMQRTPVVYIVFDLLSFHGQDLMDKPYLERRNFLERLQLENPYCQLSPYKTGPVEKLLKATAALGLEGIVAKRLDSPYQPGKRTGDWLKLKHQQRQELLIAGWLPGKGLRQGTIGSLLLGYYNMTAKEAAKKSLPQQFLYAGKAGTGFSMQVLHRLIKQLAPLERPTSPFSHKLPIPMTNIHFVVPKLIGEFEFTEWTPNHTLRHPSFKGFRYDKAPCDIIRET